MSLPKIKLPDNTAHRGVTLIELALGIMLMAIIGVTVSSLVRAGVETQMHQRMMSQAQVVVMNVVDDLRFDLRTADTVTIGGGGSTLAITGPNGNIQYTYNGTTIDRNGKVYTANVSPALTLVCDAPCFNWRADLNGRNRTIVLGNPGSNGGLQAQPVVPIGGSVVDQYFSFDASTGKGPAFFSIKQASFDVMSQATYD